MRENVKVMLVSDDTGPRIIVPAMRSAPVTITVVFGVMRSSADTPSSSNTANAKPSDINSAAVITHPPEPQVGLEESVIDGVFEVTLVSFAGQ